MSTGRLEYIFRLWRYGGGSLLLERYIYNLPHISNEIWSLLLCSHCWSNHNHAL